MSKLSILIDDTLYKKLRQLALDRDAKFQDMVRDAVLSLLAPASGENSGNLRLSPDSKIGEAIVVSIESITQNSEQIRRSAEKILGQLRELELSRGSKYAEFSPKVAAIVKRETSHQRGAKADKARNPKAV